MFLSTKLLFFERYKKFFVAQKIMRPVAISPLKMVLFGKCLYKKSCYLNCQVFVNTDKDFTPQSVCLACNHLAAFHEQVSVNSDQSTANNVDNEEKASSLKSLQDNPLNSKSNPGVKANEHTCLWQIWQGKVINRVAAR